MSYGLEKLGLAIEVLAVGEGEIKSRLERAYRHLSAVSERDFPDALRGDWTSIVERLTARESEFKGTQFDEGRLKATLHGMRRKTASKIAADILDLHSRLEGYVEDGFEA